MAKFVYVYTGGAMGATPEEQQKLMDAWMGWFGTLGDAIVDPGNPFGASATVAGDGAAHDGGAAGLNGYTIIEAASLAEATDKAKGCPVLSRGGGVQVYEAMPM